MPTSRRERLRSAPRRLSSFSRLVLPYCSWRTTSLPSRASLSALSHPGSSAPSARSSSRSSLLRAGLERSSRSAQACAHPIKLAEVATGGARCAQGAAPLRSSLQTCASEQPLGSPQLSSLTAGLLQEEERRGGAAAINRGAAAELQLDRKVQVRREEEDVEEEV